MPIDFRNSNTIWASVVVQVLAQLGLRIAVICPGSRSTPLAYAFAQHTEIESIPVLDERSAAFFALGMARQTKVPTVLVCTSGTAGANFYPAVIEAYESRVPLLILTGDRPPELRACNSGQTIDQQKLYGDFVNLYLELAVPERSLSMLTYLRQTIVHAWGRSQFPVAGVVHLNVPFRDPLHPVVDMDAMAFADQVNEDAFFAGISLPRLVESEIPIPVLLDLLRIWQSTERGIIIAGVAHPSSPDRYCEAIAQLSQYLGFPVLAEGLSPVRNFAHLNPYLISTYDAILRNAPTAQDLKPEVVIRIGDMPTSKILREWLAQTQPRQWIVDRGDRNLDPTHSRTMHLTIRIERLVQQLQERMPGQGEMPPRGYLKQWCAAESQMRDRLDTTLTQVEPLVESKVSWLLSQHLPDETPLFIANSLAVRDVEWFWKPGSRRIQPMFNRGANGIDGTLSTALGIAHHNRSSVLLTGDLALLHDSNGGLICPYLKGHLTILLVNNGGGGIFEMLPISQFDPPFEEFFVTPQAIIFETWCQLYGITYHRITHWQELEKMLNPLPRCGLRLLEIPCDRHQSVEWRQQLFAQFAPND
jgi:2-succinyl-5-enolpyruvyl-6-hydroxy-3-cyclohexene-1-carboxylate synthase